MMEWSGEEGKKVESIIKIQASFSFMELCNFLKNGLIVFGSHCTEAITSATVATKKIVIYITFFIPHLLGKFNIGELPRCGHFHFLL
jgi:hypothetical protein